MIRNLGNEEEEEEEEFKFRLAKSHMDCAKGKVEEFGKWGGSSFS